MRGKLSGIWLSPMQHDIVHTDTSVLYSAGCYNPRLQQCNCRNKMTLIDDMCTRRDDMIANTDMFTWRVWLTIHRNSKFETMVNYVYRYI